MEQKLINLIKNNWNESNFSPKPNVISVRDYRSDKEAKYNNFILVYPCFDAIRDPQTPTLTFKRYAFEAKVWNTGSSESLSLMYDELCNTIETHWNPYLTGTSNLPAFAYVGNMKDISDRGDERHDPTYAYICNIFIKDKNG